jgi:hypothetical protein
VNADPMTESGSSAPGNTITFTYDNSHNTTAVGIYTHAATSWVMNATYAL